VRIATQSEVAADFPGYLNAAKKGPVVVTNKGKAVAVLLRFESEDDVERLLMGHSPKLQAILEAARKRFREGRGIPHEEFWKEVQGEPVSKRPKRGRTTRNGRTRG
jgi:PHD/YefM family antitoxin component YafN of YafNO toxin-antitoxin module